MVNRYPKHSSTKLSERFTTNNFDCGCTKPDCDTTYVDSDLVASLEALWILSGGFSISSGFRCTYWNEHEEGKPGSQHLQGKAADLHPKKLHPVELARMCNSVASFRGGGVGTYPSFIHVDVRGYSARWSQK